MDAAFMFSQDCTDHSSFKEDFNRKKTPDAVATPWSDYRSSAIIVQTLKNEGTIEFGQLPLEKSGLKAIRQLL